MSILTALLYGIIQGFSEFLPVSSSGHLALLPFLMELKDPGVVFDLCMHLGTGLAVIIYFRKRIVELIRDLVPALMAPRSETPNHHFIRNFILATVTSVAFIFALKDISEQARNPWVIAFNQAVFGLVLWWADTVQRRSHNAEKSSGFFSRALRWQDALIIGAAQSIAIFPGVSRSGITLSAAFLRGIDRAEAGAFSFLLSIPVIFGGVVLEIPEIVQGIQTGEQSLPVMVTGILVSFMVGLATIHFFMTLIARIQLVWFTGYRLVLALILVGLLLN
ncbi:MAG: undecaprenyl-diphosphate phosphatase [Bacteriovoracia bacterium]